MSDIRSYNVGNSNYSRHSIQPWDIWIDWRLDSFHGDIVKRTLRTKQEPGMSPTEARILDYEKIKHICLELKRQRLIGIEWDKPFIVHHELTAKMVIDEYKLCPEDSVIISEILKHSMPNYDNIIKCCDLRIEKLKPKLNF